MRKLYKAGLTALAFGAVVAFGSSASAKSSIKNLSVGYDGQCLQVEGPANSSVAVGYTTDKNGKIAAPKEDIWDTDSEGDVTIDLSHLKFSKANVITVRGAADPMADAYYLSFPAYTKLGAKVIYDTEPIATGAPGSEKAGKIIRGGDDTITLKIGSGKAVADFTTEPEAEAQHTASPTDPTKLVYSRAVTSTGVSADTEELTYYAQRGATLVAQVDGMDGIGGMIVQKSQVVDGETTTVNVDNWASYKKTGKKLKKPETDLPNFYELPNKFAGNTVKVKIKKRGAAPGVTLDYLKQQVKFGKAAATYQVRYLDGRDDETHWQDFTTFMTGKKIADSGKGLVDISEIPGYEAGIAGSLQIRTAAVKDDKKGKPASAVKNLVIPPVTEYGDVTQYKIESNGAVVDEEVAETTTTAKIPAVNSLLYQTITKTGDETSTTVGDKVKMTFGELGQTKGADTEDEEDDEYGMTKKLLSSEVTTSAKDVAITFKNETDATKGNAFTLVYTTKNEAPAMGAKGTTIKAGKSTTVKLAYDIKDKKAGADFKTFKSSAKLANNYVWLYQPGDKKAGSWVSGYVLLGKLSVADVTQNVIKVVSGDESKKVTISESDVEDGGKYKDTDPSKEGWYLSTDLTKVTTNTSVKKDEVYYKAVVTTTYEQVLDTSVITGENKTNYFKSTDNKTVTAVGSDDTIPTSGTTYYSKKSS